MGARGFTVEIPDAEGEVHSYRLRASRPGLDEWAVTLDHQGTEARYRVGVDALGLWRCSCPDWKYRHRPSRGGGCKHVCCIRDVRMLLDGLTGEDHE